MGNTIGYKGKIVSLDHDPRNGVCNLCRGVVGEVNAQRDKVYQRGNHLHHEAYDDNNVLAHTEELCPACHRTIENQKGLARGGLYNKTETRDRVIRISQYNHSRLRKLGEFGMDFDDVVTKVLDNLEECEKEHKGRHDK